VLESGAGVQFPAVFWIPAFAGMTAVGYSDCHQNDGGIFLAFAAGLAAVDFSDCRLLDSSFRWNDGGKVFLPPREQ
jgi:hypothetical protein